MKTKGYILTFLLLSTVAISSFLYITKQQSDFTPTCVQRESHSPKKIQLKATLVLSPFTLDFPHKNSGYRLESCSSSVLLRLEGSLFDSTISLSKECSLIPEKVEVYAESTPTNLVLLWREIRQGRYSTDTISLPYSNGNIEKKALEAHFAKELEQIFSQYLETELLKRGHLITNIKGRNNHISMAPSILTKAPKGIRISFLKKSTLTTLLEAEVL